MSTLRRQWVNIGLVLVALVLVGVTVWDRGRVTTSEALDRRHQLLDAWRPDDISQLDIVYGERTLLLKAERDEDGVRTWSMREGGEEQEVDEQAVSEYLLTLEFASHERLVSEDDRAKLGLDAPRLKITISMGALRYTLSVGAEAPSPAGSAYAEVDSGRTIKRYVIGAPLLASLTNDLQQLRSKHMPPYLSSELRSLSLSGPQTSWTLTRGGWGGRTAAAFMLESKETGKVRAGRRAFDGWLSVLGGSEVERFVPLPKTAAAGAHRLTLTPLADKKTPAELEIGGDCPGGGTLLVRRKPTPAAGCIDELTADKLLIRATKLVDNHLLGCAEGDITELSLDDQQSDEADIDVARKADSWHMRKPNEGEVAKEPMSQWLGQLIRAQGILLSAEERADLEALGLQPPRASLQLRGLPERGIDGAPERDEKLDVGTAVEGFVYLRRHDDDAVLKLPEDIAAAFVPRASTLRPTTLENAAAEHIRELTVACGLPEQRLSRDIRGAWKRIPDAQPEADFGLAAELADQVRTLTALSWAADSTADHHQLDKPWCRIGLLVKNQEEERWIRVKLGAETRGGYFAQLEGDAAVFVVPRTLGARASTWLLDRSGLLVDYSRVTSATLSAGDKTLTVRKQGDRWLIADNPSDQLAIQVGRALEQLLAEAVVHVGAAREEDGIDPPRMRISIRLKGEDEPVELLVGAATSYRQTNVALMRRKDLDATFAVGRARLQPLFNAL